MACPPSKGTSPPDNPGDQPGDISDSSMSSTSTKKARNRRKLPRLHPEEHSPPVPGLPHFKRNAPTLPSIAETSHLTTGPNKDQDSLPSSLAANEECAPISAGVTMENTNPSPSPPSGANAKDCTGIPDPAPETAAASPTAAESNTNTSPVFAAASDSPSTRELVNAPLVASTNKNPPESVSDTAPAGKPAPHFGASADELVPAEATATGVVSGEMCLSCTCTDCSVMVYAWMPQFCLEEFALLYFSMTFSFDKCGPCCVCTVCTDFALYTNIAYILKASIFA